MAAENLIHKELQRIKARDIILVSFLCALFIIIMLTNLSAVTGVPKRDSGVFLYVGQQILNGKIPYRDIWDHKPPLVYYIDAFGLILSRGYNLKFSIYESLIVLVGIFFMFFSFRNRFGWFITFLVSLITLFLFPSLLEGGNLPEEYGLSFQFLCLFLAGSILDRIQLNKPFQIHCLILGIAAVLLFLLKQSLIAIPVSGAFYLLWKGIKGSKNHLIAFSWYLLASLLFLGGVCLVLLLHHVFPQFVSQAFLYNYLYSKTTGADRINSLMTGISQTSISGFSYYALAGFFAGLFLLLTKKFTQSELVVVLIIAFPLEIVLAIFTGRSFSHYYLAWLPVFSGLVCSFLSYFYFIVHPQEKASKKKKWQMSFASVMIIALLFGSSFMTIYTFSLNTRAALRNWKPNVAAINNTVVNYIEKNTTKGDYVLVWGAETAINFLSERQAPTRYVYQYPLYKKGYQNADLVKDFLLDIRTNPPKLIIDASTNNSAIVPLDIAHDLLEAGKKCNQVYCEIPQVDEIKEFISTHYKKVTTIDKWIFYQLKD